MSPFKAFLITPLVVPFAVTTLLISGGSGSGPVAEAVIVMVFFLGILFSYIFALILGVPSLIILKKNGYLSLNTLFISGFINALLLTSIFYFGDGGTIESLVNDGSAIVLFITTCLSAGLGAYVFGRLTGIHNS